MITTRNPSLLSRGGATAALLVAALAAAPAMSSGTSVPSTSNAGATAVVALPGDGAVVAGPVEGDTLAASTLTAGVGAAAAGRGSAKSYVFEYRVGKAPVRWNPCVPIHYRVNLRNAPPRALADVKTAVAEISRATGIKFKYDGATTVIPTSKYAAKYRPGRTTPPPVVIAWATRGKGAGQSDLLLADRPGVSDNIGVGGNYYAYWYDSRRVYHKPRYVTGYVVMNAAHNNELPSGLVDGVPGRGQALIHELGHVVGLAHTSDDAQVMYPLIRPYATFGAGDHAGLRLLGRSAGCIR